MVYTDITNVTVCVHKVCKCAWLYVVNLILAKVSRCLLTHYNNMLEAFLEISLSSTKFWHFIGNR